MIIHEWDIIKCCASQTIKRLVKIIFWGRFRKRYIYRLSRYFRFPFEILYLWGKFKIMKKSTPIPDGTPDSPIHIHHSSFVGQIEPTACYIKKWRPEKIDIGFNMTYSSFYVILQFVPSTKHLIIECFFYGLEYPSNILNYSVYPCLLIGVEIFQEEEKIWNFSTSCWFHAVLTVTVTRNWKKR